MARTSESHRPSSPRPTGPTTAHAVGWVCCGTGLQPAPWPGDLACRPATLIHSNGRNQPTRTQAPPGAQSSAGFAGGRGAQETRREGQSSGRQNLRPVGPTQGHPPTHWRLGDRPEDQHLTSGTTQWYYPQPVRRGGLGPADPQRLAAGVCAAVRLVAVGRPVQLDAPAGIAGRANPSRGYAFDPARLDSRRKLALSSAHQRLPTRGLGRKTEECLGISLGRTQSQENLANIARDYPTSRSA